jgi:Alpha-mannosidase
MGENNKIYLIGNAHIDPVWLWRWQEGYAEIKATFRSALDRMKEFPEFVFTCACAAYYKWVEENTPEMFEEIRERVKEERWVITGGWWIQPDCNIPSGEAFARHALYSQRYFLDKFGIMAKVGYNVDSFGHSGMLPQILKKSGMDFYVFMRPDEGEKKLPGNLFWWESEDGSRVMTFRLALSYASDGKEDSVKEKTLEAQKIAAKLGIDFMNFYGVGNHGGGPTIANIKAIKKMQQEQGGESYVFSSPNEYFELIKEQNINIPIVKDDLQHHASGCYSTHSETKRNNRRAEERLLCAEMFVTMAYRLLALNYPKEKFQDAWENVMFNQFHDIMGGCSIREAYRDAGEFYGKALTIGAEVLNSAIQRISWAIDTMGNEEIAVDKEKDRILWEQGDRGAPLVVFNPLSWEVEMPVKVNKKLTEVRDEKGNPVEIQIVRGSQTIEGDDKWNTVFIGKIPPMGYRVYSVYRNSALKIGESEIFELNNLEGCIGFNSGQEWVMENNFLRLEVESHTGFIKRLYDKKNDVEVFKERGAVPVVIDEVDSDTWAHGIFEFRREVAKFYDAEIRVVENGPVRVMMRVTNRYNNSVLRQDFILYRDKAEIEVQVKLEWREKHKLLKLSFPVNVTGPKTVYEIPYGYIERPVNGEEEPGQRWVDVTGRISGRQDELYGLALLNDCKYSFDVKDNDMRMTVVRSPIFADHRGERDDMCEFMEQGIQEFGYILVPHSGEWRDAGVVRKACELNVEPILIMETFHKGIMPLTYEGIRISSSNIIATALKRAEDGDGYILRCYETSGRAADTEIEIPMLGRKWTTRFGKCEIKTFLIPEDIGDKVSERNLLEMQG